MTGRNKSLFNLGCLTDGGLWLVPMLMASLVSFSSHAEREAESTSCMAEQTYRASVKEVVTQVPVETDYSCLVSPESVDSSGRKIVDTRIAQEFQRAYIPGSINLSPHFLLNDGKWKSQPVLIVNKGALIKENAALCFQLHQKGFKDAKILEGGLSAWNLSGRPLVGLPDDIHALSRMTKREFAAVVLAGTSIIVVGNSAYEQVRALFPYYVSVISVMDGSSLAESLTQAFDIQASLRHSVVVLEATLKETPGSGYQNLFTYRATFSEIVNDFRSTRLTQYKRTQVPDRYRCKGRK
ncbi:MAG: hypothetical protein CSB48_09260 [Proteobacteria bacterium]|nr:MAG: hypothetical protein CSB48_09260 [Pseudomonadota bacterium]